jgi:hypothetical protein
MQIRALKIEGSFEITPRVFPDDRGVFLESFRGDRLAQAIGHRLDIVQTNVSVSSRGTVRGVHFADLPPSQAKYVTTLFGSFIDFVIDIRVGSPTFGQWASVLLDTVDRRAIYLAEGPWATPSAPCRTTPPSCICAPPPTTRCANTASTPSTPSLGSPYRRASPQCCPPGTPRPPR